MCPPIFATRSSVRRAARRNRSPRGAYVAGVLVLVASSLFALRYGISRQLDLRRPIANFLPDSASGNKTPKQAANQKRNQKRTPEAPDENGTQADDDQK